MAGHYQIYEDRQLVVLSISGSPNLREMRLLSGECVRDPAYRASFNGVVDLRRVESSLSREEVKALAMDVVDKQVTDGFWVALVSEPITTALAIVYDRISKEQHDLHVCSTLGKASAIFGFDLAPYLKVDAGSTDSS